MDRIVVSDVIKTEITTSVRDRANVLHPFCSGIRHLNVLAIIIREHLNDRSVLYSRVVCFRQRYIYQ